MFTHWGSREDPRLEVSPWCAVETLQLSKTCVCEAFSRVVLRYGVHCFCAALLIEQNYWIFVESGEEYVGSSDVAASVV